MSRLPISQGDPEEGIEALRKAASPEVRVESDHEILDAIRIEAQPSTLFGFLTDASRMRMWLARSVEAEGRPGGILRLANLNGHWIEGNYLEVVPLRSVVFTWGGIEGLRPGQSTVTFNLYPGRDGTCLSLRHFGLSGPAVDGHRRGWRYSGLPKLKAVAEGAEPSGTCLSDAADSREQHPYAGPILW